MNDGNGGQSGHVRVYDWDGFIYLPRILMGRHQAIVSENQCLYHLTGSSWPLKLHQTMAILMSFLYFGLFFSTSFSCTQWNGNVGISIGKYCLDLEG